MLLASAMVPRDVAICSHENISPGKVPWKRSPGMGTLCRDVGMSVVCNTSLLAWMLRGGGFTLQMVVRAHQTHFLW